MISIDFRKEPEALLLKSTFIIRTKASAELGKYGLDNLSLFGKTAASAKYVFLAESSRKKR